MEFKKSFTTEKGSTVDFTVNCSVSNTNTDDKNELLSRFAETSREMYLEIAADINKSEKNVHPKSSDNTKKENCINVYGAEGIKTIEETLKHFGVDKSNLANLYMGYSEQIKNIGIAITRHIKKGKGKAVIYFDPDFPRYLIAYENDALRAENL